MKTLKTRTLLTLCAITALLAGFALWWAIPAQLTGALPAVGSAAAATSIALADTFYAGYPADCGGVPATGLCLLGSTEPLASGSFTAVEVRRDGLQPAVYPVALNQRVALPPGNYRLARTTGLDSLHELSFIVANGQITTLKTTTFKFQDSAGKYNKLQHFQKRDGINGAGCNAEIGNKGVQAYLPGNYTVSLVPTLTNTTPKCEHGGIVFNALSGQGQTIHPGTVTAQELPSANSFRHPNQVSALTSVGPYHHPIDKLAYLPGWKSFRGIQNPKGQLNDALVLSGIGTVHFVFPFKLTQGRSQCGISLAEGGLPSHVLLTDCQFANNRLTAFRVNSGAYYSFNSHHGKPALEGSYINNAILVSGVQFALK